MRAGKAPHGLDSPCLDAGAAGAFARRRPNRGDDTDHAPIRVALPKQVRPQLLDVDAAGGSCLDGFAAVLRNGFGVGATLGVTDQGFAPAGDGWRLDPYGFGKGDLPAPLAEEIAGGVECLEGGLHR